MSPVGLAWNPPTLNVSCHPCRVLKGPGVFKGRGCSWGTLKIPAGKIGVHLRED